MRKTIEKLSRRLPAEAIFKAYQILTARLGPAAIGAAIRAHDSVSGGAPPIQETLGLMGLIDFEEQDFEGVPGHNYGDADPFEAGLTDVDRYFAVLIGLALDSDLRRLARRLRELLKFNDVDRTQERHMRHVTMAIERQRLAEAAARRAA